MKPKNLLYVCLFAIGVLLVVVCSNLVPHDAVAARVEHVIHTHSLSYVGDRETVIFHQPDCPKVERIAQAQRVYLKSREAAAGHGFFPCGTCSPRGQ